MTTKIGIFTTTRADFGLWSALLEEIQSEAALEFNLFVGGAHLREEFGYTVSEIKDHGYEIADTFDYLSDKTSDYELVKSSARELDGLATIFENHTMDFVLVLGDRYEYIPIVYGAILYRVPIVHLHGGESTEGLIDEQIRHMITKASHLHFPICDEYAANIRKMGEADSRIFNTGALGIDVASSHDYMSRDRLFNQLDLDESKPTVLMTYHPVTLEFDLSTVDQVRNIFEALSQFDFQVVITGANAESESNKLRIDIETVVDETDDYFLKESLGIKNYHNLIREVEFMIGNSSSGIIEAPYFRVPTVNVGDRQDGRIRHPSVIDTDYSSSSIKKGIQTALSTDFREKVNNMEYKFGDGNAAPRIVDIIKGVPEGEQLLRKTLDFPGDSS